MESSRTVSQPTRIGRYQITRLIGRGGMGHLYLAHDPNTGRDVAIKVLSTTEDSDEFRARFGREARVLASLNHPNIVHIYDTGDFEGSPFIVMEYVAGETLEAMIKRRVPLSLSDKLRLMMELCAGLAQAHDAGIVHRDIKPANLIVDAQGRLKILDFGIARVDGGRTIAGQPLTQLNVAVGTPGYMSPEQLEAGRVDHRSDIFGVGAVCYELIAYAEAFPGSTIEQIERSVRSAKPIPLTTRVPNLDPEFDDIVMRALRTDPDRRYQDAATFERALSRLRDRLTARAQPPAQGGTVTSGTVTPGTGASGFPRSESPGRRWRSEKSEAAYRRALEAHQQGNLDAARRFAAEAVREDHTSNEARELLAKIGPARSPATEISTGAPPPVPAAASSAPTIISTWAEAQNGALPAGAATIIVPPPRSDDTNAGATRTVAVPPPSSRRGRIGALLQQRSSVPFRPDEPLWIRYRTAIQGVAALLLIGLTVGIAYLTFQWAFPPVRELIIDRPFHGTLRFGDIKCGSQGDNCRPSIAVGTPVEFLADPDDGYALKNYTGACAPSGTVQMTEPRHCGAVFELAAPIPTGPTVATLTIVPPQGGRIGGPNGLDCGGARTNCVTTIPAGQLVTLFQYADVGYSFDGFTGDCSKLDGTITMTTDRSCGAFFKPTGTSTTTTTFTPPDERKKEPGAQAHKEPGGDVAGGPTTRDGSPIGPPPNSPPVAGGPAGGPSGPPPPITEQGKDQPAPPPPLTPEQYAKGRISQLIADWCIGYKKLDVGAVQRQFPKIDLAALTRHFDQLASMKMECTIDEKAFTALDTNAGSATVVVQVKQVFVNKLSAPKAETKELIATMTLQRGQTREQWYIDSVGWESKPK